MTDRDPDSCDASCQAPLVTSRAFVGGDVIVDGVLERADVVVADGRIAAILRDRASLPAVEEIVDCLGTVVAPGFIDLQCNGAGGIDLTGEPDRLIEVAQVLPRFGVTAFLPTVVTAPQAARLGAIETMHRARSAGHAPTDGAVPLGLHFEGPAISLDHLGAHTRKYVTVPTAKELDAWIESGVVALVTVAPEIDGAPEMIERLTAAGVVVSAGHTAMSPSDFAAARRAGVSYVTHLFNAMAPFNHRSPGPIGATLADGDVVVGLICDGIHVDPVAVHMAWQSLGPHRLSLVSDAAAPLGAPYGAFRLGNFEVVHDETGVRTTGGVLAGSALELDQAVRNLMEFTGCDLLDAVATVTTTPAAVLGLADRGSIRVGHHADLTVLEPDGHLVATIIEGTTAWKS